MKTQDHNPVYAAYQHLVPRGTRYPSMYVNIFWNTDACDRVHDVEAVFIPRGGIIQRDEAGMRLWERFADYISRWSADLGNACDGWMEPEGLTPAQIFGHLLRLGFRQQGDLIEALREFGSIAEADWARDMLSAFLDEEDILVNPLASALA